MRKPGEWQMEERKPTDKFCWIFRYLPDGSKEYLAGMAGRVSNAVADEVLPLLNREVGR